MAIRREDFGEYVLDRLLDGDPSGDGSCQLTGCVHRGDTYVFHLEVDGHTEFFWFRDIGMAEIDPHGVVAHEYLEELTVALAERMDELEHMSC